MMENTVGPIDAISGSTPAAGRRRLPVWAMGLTNMPTGFVFGFVSTTMGILLSARGVPVAQVGTISFIAFSPCFWAWTLSPVLDIRFTKRAYAFALVVASAVLLAGTLLAIGNLTLFTVLLTVSCTAICLYSTAISGLMPDILHESEYDAAGGWVNVSYLGLAGLFGAMAVVLVRHLPLGAAAVVLALLVVAPAVILLPMFPTPVRPEGTLGKNFSAMVRDLRRVAHEGRIWMGLLLFLVPVGGYALTNLFSTLGRDFNASENLVTWLNGPLVGIVCALGCLLAIVLSKYVKRRTVYLGAGVCAGFIAVAMGLLPHTALVYAAGLLLYNFCQGFSYSMMNALEFDIVGARNALAGTMIAVMTASANVPISAMTYVDGHVHDRLGLRAMFFINGGSVLATIVVLMMVLPWFDRKVKLRSSSRDEGNVLIG